MKKIVLGNTRDVVTSTVKEFEDLVCATMGPYGQNIALHNDVGSPVVTKDGVSVARVIQFEDAAKDLIAQILRQAAEKTNDEAGDGTTTSTAIASATVREGNKLIASGHDVNTIRRSLSKALKEVETKLDKMRIQFGDLPEPNCIDILRKIAMISTNGDRTISDLIASAVAKAGRNGIVNVQKGSTSYDLVRSTGMKVPNAGVWDYEFIRGSVDKKVLLKKCRILITTYELESTTIIKALEAKVLAPIMNANETLIIMPKKADKGFLANMINNNAKGHLKNAVVKAPYFGAVGREMMDDVAAMTGGIVIDEAAGHKLANVQLADLGYAEEVEISPWHTIIFEPNKNEERVKERVRILEERAKRSNLREGDSDKTLERLAAITGSVWNVKIPSVSEIEDKEVMDRVEDAVNACKGALEHGYLPGGGVALLKIAHQMDSSDPYCKLLSDIISYPFKRILQNAGEAYQVVEGQLVRASGNCVYDAREGKFGEALELGVIDPYKVVSKSLANGISVGLMLLTTVGLIADVPQPASPFQWDPNMM